MQVYQHVTKAITILIQAIRALLFMQLQQQPGTTFGLCPSRVHSTPVSAATQTMSVTALAPATTRCLATCKGVALPLVLVRQVETHCCQLRPASQPIPLSMEHAQTNHNPNPNPAVLKTKSPSPSTIGTRAGARNHLWVAPALPWWKCSLLVKSKVKSQKSPTPHKTKPKS